jgi:hypothetical protein
LRPAFDVQNYAAASLSKRTAATRSCTAATCAVAAHRQEVYLMIGPKRHDHF